MDKLDPYNGKRLREFHTGVTNVMLKHLLLPGITIEERESRLADVAYGLCLALALHIKVLSGIKGGEKEKEMLKLANKTIKDAVEDESVLLGFPKELLNRYVGKIQTKELTTTIAEITPDDVNPIYGSEPPKSIVELATWVAKEALKTLIKEGFNVGGGAKGEVHFQKDDNGKMQYLILKVNFEQKEGGNERQTSHSK